MMAEIDTTKLSDEDLEAALSQVVADVPLPGEPEAIPETTEEIPPPEVTPEETEQPEQPKDPDPGFESERLRLLAEEMEARAKHWESVAGRNAGKLGYIESQLKAIQAAQAAAPQVDEQTGEPIDRTPPPQPTRDGLAEWAVQQAVAQAINGFEASHPDVKELQDKMVEHIRTSGYDTSSIFGMANPIEAQREMQRTLEEAYWHTKATVTASRRQDLLAKREAIQSQAAANKLKSSVSATASSPPPKPKAKTVDEMTDEELEKEMVRAQGGRW